MKSEKFIDTTISKFVNKIGPDHCRLDFRARIFHNPNLMEKKSKDLIFFLKIAFERETNVWIHGPLETVYL